MLIEIIGGSLLIIGLTLLVFSMIKLRRVLDRDFFYRVPSLTCLVLVGLLLVALAQLLFTITFFLEGKAYYLNLIAFLILSYCTGSIAYVYYSIKKDKKHENKLDYSN